jgi:hypothetical protein
VRTFHQLSFISSIAIVISLLSFSSTIGRERFGMSNERIEIEKKPKIQIFRPNEQNAPTETVFINLPIIEQNAQSTPEPVVDESGEANIIETETGTPTATPIPVQTGTTNLPIVIGALAIIIVIILAWFFIGFLPNRNLD